MTLAQPPYLRDLKISTEALDYEWDDGSHRRYWAKPVPPLQRKLTRLDDRALVALTAGCAEWVAWRLSSHTDVSVLLEIVEAAWVSIADWRYFGPGDKPLKRFEWDRWVGPTQRPLCAASRILIRAVDNATREMDVSYDAMYLANLAQHLLSKRQREFRQWRDSIIGRLLKTNPANENRPAGKLVAREAVDPEFDYTPSSAKKLIGAFIESVDPKKNKLLRSPAALRDVGFAGTPYEL